MAQSGRVDIPGRDVTEIGDGSDIGTSDAVMVQHTGGHKLYILPTTDATQPTFDAVLSDGILLPPGIGVNDTLANLFPDGQTYVRIWAAAPIGTTCICYHA